MKQIAILFLSTFTVHTYVVLIETRDQSYIAKCPVGAIRHLLCQRITSSNMNQLFLYKAFRASVRNT